MRLKLLEILESFGEEIEEQKVVKVVTDNGTNYVMASKNVQLLFIFQFSSVIISY